MINGRLLSGVSSRTCRYQIYLHQAQYKFKSNQFLSSNQNQLFDLISLNANVLKTPFLNQFGVSQSSTKYHTFSPLLQNEEVYISSEKQPTADELIAVALGIIEEQEDLDLESVNYSQVQMSINYLNRAAEVAPDDYRVYNFRGIAYLLISETTLALDDFMTASQLNPDELNIKYQLGRCYTQANRFKDAIELYSSLLSRDEYNFEILLLRAKLYVEVGAYQEAYQDFKRLLSNIDKMDEEQKGTTYIEAGSVYLKCDNLEESKECFLKALEYYPEDLEVHESLALIYGQDESPQSQKLTIEHLNKCIDEENPMPKLLMKRAIAYYTLQDNNRAIEECKRSLKIKDDYPVAYFMLLNIYNQMDDNVSTIKYCDTFIKVCKERIEKYDEEEDEFTKEEYSSQIEEALYIKHSLQNEKLMNQLNKEPNQQK